MSDTAQGPGETLKAAREALNVSEREVANALNLPLNVVQAMEADDFDALPPPVFTRGYLRSYARLLELDDDELVSRLPHSEDEAVTLTGEMTAVTASRLPVERQVLMLGAGIAAAVLLVILVIIGTGSDSEQPQPAVDAAVATQPDVNPSTAASAESDTPISAALGSAESSLEPDTLLDTDDQDRQSEAARVDSSAGDAAAAAPSVITAESEAVAATAETTVSPSEPAVDPGAAPTPAQSSSEAADAFEAGDPTPAGMRRITPFGEDVVTISFTEDCWVDIKDEAGARLYGDLIRGGRTIALIGEAPFQILLGYAPGARLSFNGADIDLDRVTRNNVARLTVGD